MKKILLVFTLFILGLSAHALTLSGGIEMTEQYAREYAFHELPRQIDVPDGFIYDPNGPENRAYIKGKIGKVEGRTITVLKSGVIKGYCVSYDSNPSVGYYYVGRVLVGIDKDDNISVHKYPYKSATYNSSGELISVATHVSATKTYVFNIDGSTRGLWEGNYRYIDGKVKATRKLITLPEQ